MREVRGWAALGAFLVGGLLNGWTLPTHAQSCKQSSDCAKGFSCEVTGGGTCASPGCAPNEMCPPPPPCEPVEYRECIPAECKADADCADGMVCHAEEAVGCAGPIAVAPCPPGQTCPVVTPECPAPKSFCTPKSALPCQSSSDCGSDGWACQPVMECTCSGSVAPTPPMTASPGNAGPATPVPAVDAGASGSADVAFAPPVAVDGGTAKRAPAADGGTVIAADAGIPACECHLSASKSCQPIGKQCSTDSDCAVDFRCSFDNVAVSDCAAKADGGTSSACQMIASGAALPTNNGTCTPIYSGGTKNGGTVIAPSTPTSSPGTSTDPGSGGHTADLPPTEQGGSHSADAGVDDQGDGAPVPVDQPRCSVSSVGAGSVRSSGFVMFGMLMLALRLRRQRKRA